jgi:drug/metabolite transporter (DMT)-like permease
MNNKQLKWVLLLALSLIWGSSFILIKKSLEYFNYVELGGLRGLICGLLLLPVALANLKHLPKKDIGWVALAALSGNFIPLFLFPYAQQHVSSAIAGIINSLMPLMVVIVGALVWKLKTSKTQITGLLIGFLGAAILALNGQNNLELPLFYLLVMMVSTIFYAISINTVNAKLKHIKPHLLSAFVFGLVVMPPSFAVLSFTNFIQNFSFSTQYLAGLQYVALLSIVGTGLAMMMHYKLLSISNPLFASSVTLIMPIVAIFWGVLDGEHLGYLQAIGALLIILGLLFLRKK